MSPHLDHIVILLPYSKLLSLPAWIPKHFTITPGGVHAGGQTENRLVCFQDGSYIEFISFVNDDPKNREGHCWGDCKFGVIDFAFTSSDADRNWEGLNSRLEAGNTGTRYERPREGGRERPDGIKLKWKVTWPVVGGLLEIQRGELPFFCHDITDRSLRVPLEEEHTRHPTSGYGLKSLKILVPESRVGLLVEAYEAVLGSKNIANAGGEGDRKVGRFEVERVKNVAGAEDTVQFMVQAPTEKWQREALEEKGGVLLGNIVIGVLGGNGNLIQIDIPVEDSVGSIFLDLELLSGVVADE